MSWRNYNAFLRRAKAEYALDHKTAQAFYREMKVELERPVRAVDLYATPRARARAERILADTLTETIDVAPPGSIFELTGTTHGGTPRRRRPRGPRARTLDMRPLHLKIGVQSKEWLDREEVKHLVLRAAETGIVPNEFDLSWIDWEKGEGDEAAAGTVMPSQLHSAFKGFAKAIQSTGEIRSEVVEYGEAE